MFKYTAFGDVATICGHCICELLYFLAFAGERQRKRLTFLGQKRSVREDLNVELRYMCQTTNPSLSDSYMLQYVPIYVDLKSNDYIYAYIYIILYMVVLIVLVRTTCEIIYIL